MGGGVFVFRMMVEEECDADLFLPVKDREEL